MSGAREFSLTLPSAVQPSDFAVGATTALQLDDRVAVRESDGTFGTVTETGPGGISLGTDIGVGTLWSAGPTVLRDRDHIHGDINTGGVLSPANQTSIDGILHTSATLTPLRVTSWIVTFPAVSSGDVQVNGNSDRTLVPGSYDNVTVYSGGKLHLTSGVYYVQSLDLEPQATIGVDTTNGPVFVYLLGGFTYRGSFITEHGPAGHILVGALTNQPVVLEAPIAATVVAPNAPLTLRPTGAPGTVSGQFFGQTVEVSAGTTVVHQPFPWQTVAGPTSCKSDATGEVSQVTTTAQAACTTSGCVGATSLVGTFTYSTNPTTFATTSTIVITDAAGGLVQKTIIQGGPGASIDVDVTYGAVFTGIRTVHSHSDGATVTGLIDGRAIVPMRATSPLGAVRFADGGSAPVVLVNQGTAALLNTVILRLHDAAAGSCGTSPTGGVAPPATPVSPLPDPPNAGGTPGVTQSPNKSLGGIAEFHACTAAGASCSGVAVAACAATVVFYGFCVAAAIGGCLVAQLACYAVCYGGNACCPIHCGPSFPSAAGCCDSDSTCLDSGAETCCRRGTTACRAAACCDNKTEDCNSTSGLCCIRRPDGSNSSCGDVCCGESEQCLPLVHPGVAAPQPTCCAPLNVCNGTTCCRADQSCDPVKGCVEGHPEELRRVLFDIYSAQEDNLMETPFVRRGTGIFIKHNPTGLCAGGIGDCNPHTDEPGTHTFCDVDPSDRTSMPTVSLSLDGSPPQRLATRGLVLDDNVNGTELKVQMSCSLNANNTSVTVTLVASLFENGSLVDTNSQSFTVTGDNKAASSAFPSFSLTGSNGDFVSSVGGNAAYLDNTQQPQQP